MYVVNDTRIDRQIDGRTNSCRKKWLEGRTDRRTVTYKHIVAAELLLFVIVIVVAIILITVILFWHENKFFVSHKYFELK